MATLLGPWDVQYPVNFYENGDTVTQAFGKHIEEIVRIYGLLNALDAGKVTVEDFNAAMAAERQARINGDNAEAAARANADQSIWNKINSLNFGDIHGNLDFSRVTGNVPADRVHGNLSNATIDSGKVNGLVEAIKANGGVETGSNYMKIGSLLVQWGSGTVSWTVREWEDKVARKITLPTPSSKFRTGSFLYEQITAEYRPVGYENEETSGLENQAMASFSPTIVAGIDTGLVGWGLYPQSNTHIYSPASSQYKFFMISLV